MAEVVAETPRTQARERDNSAQLPIKAITSLLVAVELVWLIVLGLLVSWLAS